MFTGIVETIGVVEEVKELNQSEGGIKESTITIGDSETVLLGYHKGDSISVNGVRLIISEYTTSSFKVAIPTKILDCTNLINLVKGDKVNLERAVAGGHVVQGNVSTIATITSIQRDKNSSIMIFEPEEVTTLDYIVEKGFITLEGESLIVSNVTETTFSVTLTAHKKSNITIGSKKVGDIINVEVDIFGKLIEKQVERQFQKHAEKQAEIEAIKPSQEFLNPSKKTLESAEEELLEKDERTWGSVVTDILQGIFLILLIIGGIFLAYFIVFIVCGTIMWLFMERFLKPYFIWLAKRLEL